VVDYLAVHAAQEADGAALGHLGGGSAYQIGNLVLLEQQVVKVFGISVALKIKLLVKQDKFLIRIHLHGGQQRIHCLPGTGDNYIVLAAVAVVQESGLIVGHIGGVSAHLLNLEVEHILSQLISQL